MREPSCSSGTFHTSFAWTLEPTVSWTRPQVDFEDPIHNSSVSRVSRPQMHHHSMVSRVSGTQVDSLDLISAWSVGSQDRK